jgi:hypothetical protein
MPDPATNTPTPSPTPAPSPSPTPSPSPSPTPSATNAAWYGELPADLPQDLREWVGNKQFKDPVTALQSQFNLEKLIGFEKAGRTIVLPKDENDVEGRKAFHAKLGVPDSADKYTIPEALKGDQLLPSILKAAHEAGAPAKLMESVLNVLATEAPKLGQQWETEAKEKSQREVSQLRAEWGNDAVAKEEIARRGLQAYGKQAGLDDNDLAGLETTLGTAKMLKMFLAVGAATQEIALAGGDSPTGVTPNSARQMLDEARTKRTEGKIGQNEYLSIMEKYGPIAAKAS